MRTQIRKLRRALIQLALVPDVLHSIDSQKNATPFSPVDRYLIDSAECHRMHSGLFDPSYRCWTVNRITKILAIYGIDYFRGKRVLELGAGHGEIGAFFADLGADVLCLDGRIENVNYTRLKHRGVSGIRSELFNLEEDFSGFGRFDLIINMGLLYHLKNVDGNLRCCFSMADEVIVETVVCDSLDPNTIFLCDERCDVDEESITGTGSRPSPFYIESIAQESGFEVIRHFSADLNSKRREQSRLQFDYTWEHRNDNRMGDGFRLRRFWRMRRLEA